MNTVEAKISKIAKTKQMIYLSEKEASYWAGATNETYETAKKLGIGKKVVAQIEKRKGDIPLITSLVEYNEASLSEVLKKPEVPKNLNAATLNLEKKTGIGEVPKKELDYTAFADGLTNGNSKDLNKKLTAHTIKALVGTINPDNIVDVIKKIYETYKNLK